MSYEAKIALMNVSKTGVEYFKELEQNMANQNFMNASNVYLIKAENKETKVFDEMYVRIVEAKSRLLANSYEQDQFKKIIFKDLKYNPFVGQIIKIEDKDWIVVDSTAYTTVFSDCIIERCNRQINFIKNGDIYSCPAIVKNKSLRLDISLIRESAGNYRVTIPYNDETKLISSDDRFVIKGHAIKVMGLPDILSQEGLIHLNCEDTEKDDQYDDLVNDIADRFKPENNNANSTPTPIPSPTQPTVTYEIASSSTYGFDIKRYNTYTFSINKKVNNVIDNAASFNISLDYNSNPNTIATFIPIDSKSCKVKNNTSINGEVLYLKFEDLADGTITSQEVRMVR